MSKRTEITQAEFRKLHKLRREWAIAADRAVEAADHAEALKIQLKEEEDDLKAKVGFGSESMLHVPVHYRFVDEAGKMIYVEIGEHFVIMDDIKEAK